MRVLMLLVPDPVSENRRQLTLDRIAAPYYLFREAGLEVVMASPDGGAPQAHSGIGNPSDAASRFNADRAARDALADTLPLREIDPTDFSAVFCIGIVGPLSGSAGDGVGVMLRAFLTAGRPAAVLPGWIDVAPDEGIPGLLILGEDATAPSKAVAAVIGVLRAERPPR